MASNADASVAGGIEKAEAVRYLTQAATATDTPTSVLRRFMSPIRELVDDHALLPKSDFDLFELDHFLTTYAARQAAS
ncbi:hypothetical protein [Burkholderia orbicola]|uniref:hypothetical protein n=1 Tax=Burkholderia orbicola TaxID=2978683 RepID=UPI0039A56CEF